MSCVASAGGWRPSARVSTRTARKATKHSRPSTPSLLHTQTLDFDIRPSSSQASSRLVAYVIQLQDLPVGEGNPVDSHIVNCPVEISRLP